MNRAYDFIHETDNETSEMQIRAFTEKPASGLDRQIEMCWFGFGEKECGKAFYEIPPDGSVNLILRFSSSNCRAFLVGLTNEKECLEIDESCNYFGIRFRPGQAFHLADIHHAELVNSYGELPKILGLNVDSLGERLLSLPTLSLRQRFLEELLLKARPMVRDERCRRCTALVADRGGVLTVAELASMAGLHVRNLERLFLEHLGVTPKQFIRVIRFQHLLAHMRANNHQTLTTLAYICGYFDQSHMIKDFKELTGRLPGETGSCKNRRLTEEPDVGLVHCLS